MDLTNEGGAGVDCAGRGNPAPRVEWRQVPAGGPGLPALPGLPGSAVRAVPGVRHLLDNGSLVFPPFQVQVQSFQKKSFYRTILGKFFSIFL